MRALWPRIQGLLSCCSSVSSISVLEFCCFAAKSALRILIHLFCRSVDNQIGDEGAKALADGLCKNMRLRFLYLGCKSDFVSMSSFVQLRSAISGPLIKPSCLIYSSSSLLRFLSPDFSFHQPTVLAKKELKRSVERSERTKH